MLIQECANIRYRFLRIYIILIYAISAHNIGILPSCNQELTFALINSGQVSRIGSVTHHNHIADFKGIKRSQVCTCTAVEFSTTVVGDHFIQAFVAFRRFFCQNIALAPAKPACLFYEAAQQHSGIASSGNATGINVQINCCINLCCKGRVCALPFSFCIQSCDACLGSIAQGCAGRCFPAYQHIFWVQIRCRFRICIYITVDIGISLTGPQDQEHIIRQCLHSCRIAGGFYHLLVTVQRSKGIVAQVNQHLPGCDIPFFALQTTGNRTLQVHINQNIACFQIFDIGIDNARFVVIVVGVDPNTAEVTIYQHIAVDAHLACHFIGTVELIQITSQGFIVVGMQTIGLIQLKLREHTCCQFLHSRKLKIQACPFVINPFCKGGAVNCIGRELIARIAVPVACFLVNKGSVCSLKLLAADGGGQHIGRNVCNIAAAIDDLIAHFAGSLYRVGQFYRFSGSKGYCPDDLAVCIGAVAGNIGGVNRNGFCYLQAAVIGRYTATIQVMFIVGIVSDLNGIGQSAALGHSAIVLCIHSALDVHTGELQTAGSRISNTKTDGGHRIQIIVTQSHFQFADIQHIIDVQLVVGRICVAIGNSQNIQGTNHNQPCAVVIIVSNGALPTTVSEAKVAALLCIANEGAFNGCQTDCAIFFHAVFAGGHIELAATAMENRAVAYIEHSMLMTAVAAHNDDITGTEVIFPIIEEIECCFCRVGGCRHHAIIVSLQTILNRSAYTTIPPTKNCHILGVSSVIEQACRYAVNTISQNGVTQGFIVHIPAVVRANTVQIEICRCIFQGGEGVGAPRSAVVLAQRTVAAIGATGVKFSGVILHTAALQAVSPCHFHKGFFQILAGYGRGSSLSIDGKIIKISLCAISNCNANTGNAFSGDAGNGHTDCAPLRSVTLYCYRFFCDAQ